MTKIHMETEDVRETARLLDWTAGELYFMPPKLRGLAASISNAWQGGRSDHYAGELRRHSETLQREVVNLQRLAVRVSNEVTDWEATDAAFGKVVSQMVKPWWEISSGVREFIGSTMTYGKGLATLGVIGGLAVGSSYAGQVIFNGGQGLKNIVGLSPNLTHIKDVNIASHLVSQSRISGLEVGMAAWEFAEKGAKDWANYESGGEKAAALGIDALFVTAKTLVTQYAAHVITTAAVGFLVTAGAPAVGVAAAGLAVWWGSSYVASAAMDSAYNLAEQWKLKDSIVKTGGSHLNKISQDISNIARSVDQAFQPTIQRTL